MWMDLAGQPLTGLTGNRSLDDEKLIQMMIESSHADGIVVLDARPKANAVANQMKGLK